MTKVELQFNKIEINAMISLTEVGQIHPSVLAICESLAECTDAIVALSAFLPDVWLHFLIVTAQLNLNWSWCLT